MFFSEKVVSDPLEQGLGLACIKGGRLLEPIANTFRDKFRQISEKITTLVLDMLEAENMLTSYRRGPGHFLH